MRCSGAEGILVNDRHLFVLKYAAEKPKATIQRLFLMGKPLLRI